MQKWNWTKTSSVTISLIQLGKALTLQLSVGLDLDVAVSEHYLKGIVSDAQISSFNIQEEGKDDSGRYIGDGSVRYALSRHFLDSTEYVITVVGETATLQMNSFGQVIMINLEKSNEWLVAYAAIFDNDSSSFP